MRIGGNLLRLMLWLPLRLRPRLTLWLPPAPGRIGATPLGDSPGQSAAPLTSISLSIIGASREVAIHLRRPHP
jgi:hypothetical protein